MKRILIATLVAACLAGVVAWSDVLSAQTRKQEVRAAPGLATVTLYTSKARDKVLRQVPAASINGTYDVDASSSSAIAIRLGKELVWLDTFDVIVSDPGKSQAAKEDCVVLSKGLKSEQSNMGMNTGDCSKRSSR